MIEFTHGGEVFRADTPEEAVKLRALLKKQDAKAADKRVPFKHGGKMDQLMALVAEEESTPWTAEVFHSYIDRLGRSQLAALAALVTHRNINDVKLRKAVNVSGNQALAGVLSGISKQAAALGIPAREIFSFENLRSEGKRRSTYTVAEKFLAIATQQNWPPAALQK